MNTDYTWPNHYSSATLMIFSVTTGFIVYWFLAVNKKIKSKFFNKSLCENAWVAYVVYQKLMGALFIGALPFLVFIYQSKCNLIDAGINLRNYKETITYLLVIIPLILFFSFFSTKSKANLIVYPQMRLKHWNIKVVIINTLSWTVYIFFYELSFRGLLLMSCYHAFGFWPALAINLAIYSSTHIAKGLAETIGTLPFGFLMCFATISTGSIAFAVVAHLLLALSNDYFSIYHHPKMNYI